MPHLFSFGLTLVRNKAYHSILLFELLVLILRNLDVFSLLKAGLKVKYQSKLQEIDCGPEALSIGFGPEALRGVFIVNDYIFGHCSGCLSAESELE